MKNLLSEKDLAEKRQSNNMQIRSKYLLFIIGFIITISVILFGINKFKPSVSTIRPEPTFTPTPTPDPFAPKNILILGYAGGTHEGGLLTDTIMVAHIRPKDRQVILISIPRDLWVNIPVKDGEDHFQKINAAFAYGSDDRQFPEKKNEYKGTHGGGNLAKYIVQTVTGLPIDYYMAINFQGFEKAVDILGGVDINVPQTFDDEFYPIEEKKSDPCGKTSDEIDAITATMSGILLDKEFPCRYEKIHFDKGNQIMNGATALKFVRSRKSETDGGDYSRSRRQQALISGIKDKLLRIGSIPKIIPLLQTASTYTMTDMNLTALFDFLKNREEILDSKITTILLTEDNVLQTTRSIEGLYILTPKTGDQDFQSIHDFLSEEIEKQILSISPTSTELQ